MMSKLRESISKLIEYKDSNPIVAKFYALNGVVGEHIESILGELGYTPENTPDLSAVPIKVMKQVISTLKNKYQDDINRYGDDADVPYELYDLLKLKESVRHMCEDWYDDEPKWYEQGEDEYAVTYELMYIAEDYIKDRLKKNYEIDDVRWGETGFIIPIFYAGSWDGNPEHPPKSEYKGEFSFYFDRYDSKEEAIEYLKEYLDDFIDGHRGLFSKKK